MDVQPHHQPTTVTVNALPTPTITPGGATIFCAGGSVNLTATLASLYSWSTGETTRTILATTAGGRTVTITDVNGCSATSSATTVIVNALPTATINPGSCHNFLLRRFSNPNGQCRSFLFVEHRRNYSINQCNYQWKQNSNDYRCKWLLCHIITHIDNCECVANCHDHYT